MKLGVFGLLAVAAILLSGLTGCETLTQTPGENLNMVGHTSSINVCEITEDWDNIWLLDHASWLSKKPIPQN